MDIIKSIEHEQLKNKVPVLDVGNTVRVHVRIKEGNRERIQVFEGIIIKKQGGGVNETFTVRRISYGVGVEKTFLVHSPLVEKVELVRVGKARRAKLYYLRDRVGKAAKTKEKIGARIENREIVIKEEVVPGESATEEVVTEESVQEAVEADAKIEAAKAEEAKTEETVSTETKVEEVKEEVKEEKAEETKTEEPAKVEKKVEEAKAEEPAKVEEKTEETKADETEKEDKKDEE